MIQHNLNSLESHLNTEGIALRYMTAYDYFMTCQSLGQREVRQKPDPEAHSSQEGDILLPTQTMIRSGLVQHLNAMTAVKHVIERTKIMAAT